MARFNRTTAQEVAGRAIEVVYPPRCAGCGRRGTWVCDDCLAAFPLFGRAVCGRCGEPSPGCCCATVPVSLDLARSAGRHAHWLRAAVLAFKYHGERQRYRHLGASAAAWIDAAWAVDAIVPVPLHRQRERARGYNQAALLAREVGAVSGVPVTRALVRTIDTPQQVGLPAASRRRNLVGAFEIAPGIQVKGQRLLLIDDVMTTGTTLGACAETLLAGGAVWVSGLTVAREG